MNQNLPNNTSDEIIDFDDEYCENDQETPTPDEPPKYKYQLEQKDQVQALPEEDEEDQDQKENNVDIDNIIYDPKVKELNELDINNKQAIIDILMNDDLIIKKALKTEEAIKEKNKNKFSYVKPTLITKNNPNEPPEKSLYSKYELKIDEKEGNPELVKDINVAANLLKDQIAEENQDVAKLLFDDITKTKSEKKILTGKEIGEKIKKTLENKKKHLQKIENEMYKNKKDIETFKPTINHRKNDGEKRNLNTFLKNQKEFMQDVMRKKQDLMIQLETAMKDSISEKPKVNKNSEKLAEKISGTGPAYMRLYNKRSQNKEKIREFEEKMILKEKEEEQKRKEKENELKKNNPYKHIKSRINNHRNNQNELAQQLNKDDNSAKKLNRGKSAINIMRHNNLTNNTPKTKFDYKDIQSNKILFNKFVSNFDEALISLGQGEDSKNNEANLEELDEYQYHKLLFKLGMVSYPPEQKAQKEENQQNNKEEEKNVVNENKIQFNEKKLVNDSFNFLKLEGDKAKIIDIKNFLICVVDMQNYNLYQMFKSAHEQELKELFPPEKFKKEDIPELIITKQNEELLSKIDKANKKNNKYFSISTENKIIFTLDKSPTIKKDFNMFSLNYRNQKKKSRDDKIMNMMKEQCPFKPEINEKSNKLYQKYKDKVFALQNETVTSNSNSQIKKGANMEYIDRILLLDKKRIAETQKIKEEMEKNQIKECTFKPRINSYQFNKKGKKQKEEDKNSNEANESNTKLRSKKNNNSNKKNMSKFDELYEDGKNRLKNKISKTREEIELEEQKNECTFQPNVKGLDPKKIPKTNFNNDIYNEKEYKILYERLKHGRLERMVKDSNNDRYGLNNELKQFVKDNKEFNFIQNQQYFDPDDPFYYNNAEINNMMNNLNNQFEQENIEKSNIIKDSINNSQDMNKKEITKLENKDNNMIHNNNENNVEYVNNNLILEKGNKIENENNNENEDDKEKNDDIPLLIIDVNIRQGVKKKIYVYDGDTPEALAEKFAKEQNLDTETKNKLQSLIHTHMQKLLTRIEEENQSNSEKSQNIQNRKNS